MPFIAYCFYASYCDEKRELQDDYDIFDGTHKRFDSAQCYQDGKKDLTALLTQVKDSTMTAVQNAWNSTSQDSTEKWAVIKDACSRVLGSTDAALAPMWGEAQLSAAE
jgi:hypothetical protein